MKIALVSLGLILSSYGLMAQKFKTTVDTFSYCLGLNIADNLKKQGIKEINPKLFIKAIETIYTDAETAFTIDKADSIVNDYFIKLKDMAAQENLEKGKKFLEENKKNEGVVALESGLQYKIITEGTGPKPKATDKVLCHYKGTLIDGTVFDSSYDRGEPISFPLNGVISGWTEALQLMGTGSKWILYIPSDMAYGERGAGGVIGPNETLIFEVELISIN